MGSCICVYGRGRVGRNRQEAGWLLVSGRAVARARKACVCWVGWAGFVNMSTLYKETSHTFMAGINRLIINSRKGVDAWVLGHALFLF